MNLDKSIFIHQSSFVDKTSRIGLGTKVWHFCNIMKNAKIGKNCTIGQNVMIGSNVEIGDNCKIQNNVSIYTGVKLEDNVFCGPSCVFTNILTPRANINRKKRFLPTIVKNGATIGANATILCGNDLGEYCMIAAGSVVSKNVLNHSLEIGSPSKHVGWVSKAGIKLGEDLYCPYKDEQYILVDGLLKVEDKNYEN